MAFVAYETQKGSDEAAHLHSLSELHEVWK